ncbi:type I-F CRISPR-associated protein Csy3 [Erwinia pyrifoliae]|uniref:Type I-F CRISPR-associated protein Csy3 n=1 Tax=Erwinia pyrifoliae TaxID=79967 RepID=A0ABY5X5P3_ERWPY|nr:type I-F CRISPR-associated protein Csy3 [Erwinia pyrifoliae]AUX73602.1 type I-F CRISPR-associated protein Cas7f/Csy3 [Erwinia pyrifoliae]MCA8876090.1 type I-F CRISPR-associated protein Csy3 [Erwinia pyrifoliae]UWS28570.1 type I-F CRISPR-associated protein Csy3 [Erwinia pyrifoliae]UWS32714.1 type I-F CRISPR-associated protein Csy3 [Erwinia pyrifoliae]UXK11563.1 type I-F CRISPR-associated protein Csy3 [Erwinia pyrifoliae]
MAKSAIKTASVLAFERKLSNSDAIMLAGKWQDEQNWTPIKIQEKAVRGTISNRLKNAIASDPLKLDAEIQKPNLQRVDVAALPYNCDSLKVCFTLRVLSGLATPAVCNDRAYQAALAAVIDGYIARHGFSTLAARYAENIANGRFLWRNRLGAGRIAVQVTSGEKCWQFDSYDYSLQAFSQPQGDLLELAQAIEQGLSGNSFALFNVEARVYLGNGQEVFPSQELVLDGNSKKSKLLYQIDGTAAIHSQKIGNALRTIDSWYPDADELDEGPISVEPYGSVTSRGIAYRQPIKKMDFYNLLDNWVTKDKEPDTEQQHYVMAILIRGGVFGEKSE